MGGPFGAQVAVVGPRRGIEGGYGIRPEEGYRAKAPVLTSLEKS